MNASTPPGPFRKTVTHGMVLMAILVTCLVAVHHSPLRSYLTDAGAIRDGVDALGWLGPVIFAFAVAGLVAVGVPRLALCTLSGYIFGFAGGMLYCLLGNLLGYYISFLIVRRGGHALSLARWERSRRLAGFVRNNGVLSVLLLRLLPLNGLVSTVALALSSVRHRDFLLGSALGLVPEAIPMTLLGSGVLHPSFSHGATYILAAVALLVLILIGERACSRFSAGGASLSEEMVDIAESEERTA